MRCCKCFLILLGLVYGLCECSTHTSEHRGFFREQLLLTGPRCGAWELDASLCVFANPWEMALGWVQFVCILQSSSPGRSSPLLLLETLMPLWLLAPPSVPLWHLLSCSHCSFKFFKEKSTCHLQKIHLFFIFFF